MRDGRRGVLRDELKSPSKMQRGKKVLIKLMRKFQFVTMPFLSSSQLVISWKDLQLVN